MILSVLFSGTILFQSIGLNDLITFQLGGCDNESEKVYHLIGYVEKSPYDAWMFAFSKFNDPSFSS
jgi:hypothetical protein